MSAKTGMFRPLELPVCPHCGEKRDFKQRITRGQQQYRCASYVTFFYAGRAHGKPPELPPNTPMPPLSNGRIKETQKRRGKLFGHREVIIVCRISVRLDPVSYRGLLWTMNAKKMTRQEAARYLILGTRPKFVGQRVKTHHLLPRSRRKISPNRLLSLP